MWCTILKLVEIVVEKAKEVQEATVAEKAVVVRVVDYSAAVERVKEVEDMEVERVVDYRHSLVEKEVDTVAAFLILEKAAAKDQVKDLQVKGHLVAMDLPKSPHNHMELLLKNQCRIMAHLLKNQYRAMDHHLKSQYRAMAHPPKNQCKIMAHPLKNQSRAMVHHLRDQPLVMDLHQKLLHLLTEHPRHQQQVTVHLRLNH